jgi:hypothetical protein
MVTPFSASSRIYTKTFGVVFSFLVISGEIIPINPNKQPIIKALNDGAKLTAQNIQQIIP